MNANDGALKLPRFQLLTLGSGGHGKSYLLAVIDKLRNGPSATQLPPAEFTWIDYESDGRRYSCHGRLGKEDLDLSIVDPAQDIDCMILVVSVIEGPTIETRRQLWLACLYRMPKIVVFLSKTDLVEDPSQIQAAEDGLRKLLAECGFSSEAVPIVSGSALSAWQDRDPVIGRDAIWRLLDQIDSSIPERSRSTDAPFLMRIDDTFLFPGGRTVVAGRVERGVGVAGQKVEIVGLKATRVAEIIGFERFRQQVNSVEAGEHVAAFLRDIERNDVLQGQVLCAPGSAQAHTRFTAEAYLLTKQEGGRHKPFSPGETPSFYFRSTGVAGVVTGPVSIDRLAPGEPIQIAVELSAPVVIEAQQRFAIRSGGSTVGAGRVTDVLK